jgi:hypothetical protein
LFRFFPFSPFFIPVCFPLVLLYHLIMKLKQYLPNVVVVRSLGYLRMFFVEQIYPRSLSTDHQRSAKDFQLVHVYFQGQSDFNPSYLIHVSWC